VDGMVLPGGVDRGPQNDPDLIHSLEMGTTRRKNGATVRV